MSVFYRNTDFKLIQLDDKRRYRKELKLAKKWNFCSMEKTVSTFTFLQSGSVHQNKVTENCYSECKNEIL